MKTVLVTNGNLSSCLALREFIEKNGHNLCGVVITTRLPSQKNNASGVVDMFRQSGSRYTSFKLLTNLILPRLVRRHGAPASVEDLVKRGGWQIPIIRTPNVNDPSVVEKIREMKPEVLLSFSSTKRFKKKLMAVPTKTAINVHYALLPEYAGLSPYFWYLANGERECGVTMHIIASKLDAGDVIDQRRFPIKANDSVLNVLLQQSQMVSPMLNKLYDGDYDLGAAQHQDMSKRSYCGHPGQEDVKRLLENGHKFYNRSDLKHIHQLSNPQLEA